MVNGSLTYRQNVKTNIKCSGYPNLWTLLQVESKSLAIISYWNHLESINFNPTNSEKCQMIYFAQSNKKNMFFFGDRCWQPMAKSKTTRIGQSPDFSALQQHLPAMIARKHCFMAMKGQTMFSSSFWPMPEVKALSRRICCRCLEYSSLQAMLDPAAAEDSSCRQLVQAVVEQPDRGCFYAFNSTLIKMCVKVFIFC